MENQDINEESINNQEENNVQNDATSQDNVTATPSAEELLAEEKDRYIRLYAEFENYKKRTSKEKMEFFQYANQEMMVSMLGVLDDFERAIKATEKSTEVAPVREGIELVQTKLKSILSQKGLKEIESLNTPFDTDLHEAITQIPSPTEEQKGKVIDQLEKGYMLNDKVVRFAKVVVGA